MMGLVPQKREHQQTLTSAFLRGAPLHHRAGRESSAAALLFPCVRTSAARPAGTPHPPSRASAGRTERRRQPTSPWRRRRRRASACARRRPRLRQRRPPPPLLPPQSRRRRPAARNRPRRRPRGRRDRRPARRVAPTQLLLLRRRFRRRPQQCPPLLRRAAAAGSRPRPRHCPQRRPPPAAAGGASRGPARSASPPKSTYGRTAAAFDTAPPARARTSIAPAVPIGQQGASIYCSAAKKKPSATRSPGSAASHQKPPQRGSARHREAHSAPDRSCASGEEEQPVYQTQSARQGEDTTHHGRRCCKQPACGRARFTTIEKKTRPLAQLARLEINHGRGGRAGVRGGGGPLEQRLVEHGRGEAAHVQPLRRTRGARVDG